MGIGDTMKHMFDNVSQHGDKSEREGDQPSSRNVDRSSRSLDTDPTRRSSHRLPSGTGPGTSGKPSHETAMEQDLDRARSGQGAAGYGTDAAAATGGSLSGTHQGARTSYASQHAPPRSSTVPGTKLETSGSRAQASDMGERATSEHLVLEEAHTEGHRKRDIMPTGDTVEDTRQLHPVTHEYIRHIETEEIERVKDVHRHVHHVQHHTQPIVVKEELAEKLQEFVHPVTHIQEQHVNKGEDSKLLEGQVHQYRDTLQHGARERTIIDKGTVVNEHVHHHVHHVIQPVIEKETIDRARIHTTVPIKEVTQEAPIVHQSQTHAPIPLEHFVERGGALEGGISQDEIGRTVLQTGKCTRDVEGIADELAEKLHLGKETHAREGHNPELITTKVTQRTTTVIDPELYSGGDLPAGRN